MQPRVRKLHLRLDTRRPDYPTLRRPLSQIIQQHRLADPRLPANNQHSTAPLAHIIDDAAEQGALTRSTPQHNSAMPIFHAGATIVPADTSRYPAAVALRRSNQDFWYVARLLRKPFKYSLL